LRACALKPVQSTRLDQAFQHLAIGYARIEPAAEILHQNKLATFVPLAYGHGHRCFADVFDRSEAVTNGVVAAAVSCDRLRLFRTAAVSARGYTFWCEFQTTLVDIRRENGNPHSLAFTYENRNFVRVIDLVA